ncbi:MAG: glycyl radical protein [Deltaproteobacteria bacterium]|nr:glycyl radical protein [Deltaproteobacteria bacterium]
MERGFTKRTQKLRNESVSTKPNISMERSILITEAYKKYEGTVDIPILRALTFRHLMENKKLHISSGDLIVGEKGPSPLSVPTYPELCCHTLDDLDVMNNRERIGFEVVKDDLKIQEEIIIPFWEKRSIRSKIFEHVSDEWKDCYHAGIFTEFMEQRSPGHTVADGKIYEKGFSDFIADIDNEIVSIDYKNDRRALDRKVQLNAMRITCEAIISYGKRYYELAISMANNEKSPERKEELLKIAENCKTVPANKPKSYWQAVQMYWFIHIGVTSELNNWDAYSPGRLDQHLIPFYNQDTESGEIGRGKARELLECLWIKFNNQPAPPKVGITLKESATYTDFANINTGGIKKDGSNGVNEVSYLILETMDEMKLLQPSSNVQISKKTPNNFLRKALEVSRKGWGQPAFYNTDVIVQELILAGKEIRDARQGGASGCVETGAFGKEAYILTGYFNLPKILEITLNNGFDDYSSRQIGLKTGEVTDFKSYEEILSAYEKQLKHFIDIKIIGNNIIERIYGKQMPAPFLSVITDDCIKRGMDYNEGGARYNTSYLQGVGIGTITDCLTSIKYNVFDEKKITMEELISAINSNFEGHENIYNLVKHKTPKYGNDDDYADNIMKSVFDMYHRLVTNRPNMKGGTYRINMLPTTCHIYFGSVMKASVNGRLSGKPLPDGISPEKGADVNGPTSVIKSASKMDHINTGGTLLNQKFSPSIVEGEKGINNLASLVKSYFALDGHHIQFNIIDKKVLMEAQKNPDDYNDLIVRVAGYSDHFNNLEKALQDEIIERTDQKFN